MLRMPQRPLFSQLTIRQRPVKNAMSQLTTQDPAYGIVYSAQRQVPRFDVCGHSRQELHPLVAGQHKKVDPSQCRA